MAAGQRADELAVADDSELFSSWKRVRRDVLAEKALEGLTSVEDLFVCLELFAACQGGDPSLLQVQVGEVVFKLGEHLSLLFNVVQGKHRP